VNDPDWRWHVEQHRTRRAIRSRFFLEGSLPTYDDLAPQPIQRGAGIGVVVGLVLAMISQHSVFDGALFGLVAGICGGAVYGWLRRS
jgi:hypothetical protein